MSADLDSWGDGPGRFDGPGPLHANCRCVLTPGPRVEPVHTCDPPPGSVAFYDAELSAAVRAGLGPDVIDHLLDKRNGAQ